ncbi:MAG: helix-turn-helix domain-containing protein [Ferruginibacter sp.]
MTKKDIHFASRSDCAVSMALDTIGDKWSLLIIRDLMFTDKRTYGELQSSEEKIATNILAARLTSLEENGIIRKQPDVTDSRRSLYYLTEKGIELLPVITEMMHWMNKNDPNAVSCNSYAPAYKKDRVGMYKELTKKLKKEHLG